jgi:hypothetical protein
MVAISTAERYRKDNGPVVFGVPGIAVRWNRLTKAIVVEMDNEDGAYLAMEGADAERLLLALAAAHRQGLMRQRLHDMLRPAWLAFAWMDDGWYRVGRRMVKRPVSQEPV